MIISDTARCVQLLQDVNYSDSALFGISCDIFKVQLLITARQSSLLADYGLNPFVDDLQCDFRYVRSLQLNVDKSMFGPPWNDAGELMALDFSDFEIECLDIPARGINTDAGGSLNYAINIPFTHGAVGFEFADLKISRFKPERKDRRKT